MKVMEVEPMTVQELYGHMSTHIWRRVCSVECCILTDGRKFYALNPMGPGYNWVQSGEKLLRVSFRNDTELEEARLRLKPSLEKFFESGNVPAGAPAELKIKHAPRAVEGKVKMGHVTVRDLYGHMNTHIWRRVRGAWCAILTDGDGFYAVNPGDPVYNWLQSGDKLLKVSFTNDTELEKARLRMKPGLDEIFEKNPGA